MVLLRHSPYSKGRGTLGQCHNLGLNEHFQSCLRLPWALALFHRSLCKG